MAWLDDYRKRKDKERAAYEQYVQNQEVAEALEIIEKYATSKQIMASAIIVLAREQTIGTANGMGLGWIKRARAALEQLYAQLFKRRTNNGKHKNNTQTTPNTVTGGTGDKPATQKGPPQNKNKI